MFTLPEEHHMLAEAAKGFIAEKMPTAHLRALRDGANAEGFDRALWAEIAAMGWTGILAPEALGGVDLGYRAAGLVLREMGATLAPTPFLSTAVIGVSALRLGGSDRQQSHWLPKIAAGEAIFALCVDEGAHHAPGKIAMAAEKSADGFVLTGEKTFVADGQCADQLIVAARLDGAIALFLVDANAAGVTRRSLTTIDSRGGADIGFNAVAVGAEDMLHLPDEASDGVALVDHILDRARIALAAEMLGQAESMFAQTAEYLKTRSQFGQLIGSFQGLQHRAGKMLVDMELTKSCVLGALAVLDEGKDPRTVAEYASLAKARACDTLHTVSNEMVQMHGGIGMTDAHDAGLYLKRARVAEALYGGAGFHRDRYASLGGF
jgi:alkylation response protein AidB-like acyl-CoA dehydrogenase